MENVAKLISNGDYGKVISSLFDILSSSNNEYNAEIDSCLSFALTQFTTRLISSNHILNADWLWKRAIGLTQHKYYGVMHSFSRYLGKKRYSRI